VATLTIEVPDELASRVRALHLGGEALIAAIRDAVARREADTGEAAALEAAFAAVRNDAGEA
jgi:hypothetical protein